MRYFPVTIGLTSTNQNDCPAGLLSISPRKDLAFPLYCLCRPVKHARLKPVHFSALYTFAACYMRFARRPSSRGITLDDIYSGMLFTPDSDDLLDVSSGKDVGLKVTLPSISSSKGRAHTPFARYAVLGDSSDLPELEAATDTLGNFYVPGQNQAGEKSAWT